jgi:hypothetical protein
MDGVVKDEVSPEQPTHSLLTSGQCHSERALAGLSVIAGVNARVDSLADAECRRRRTRPSPRQRRDRASKFKKAF